METLIKQQKRNLLLVFVIGFVLFISILFASDYKILKDYKPEDLFIILIFSLILILFSYLCLKINKVRRELKMLAENLKIDEVQASDIFSEYSAGDRDCILTDKIKLHIKTVEGKIYYFILNPLQFSAVISDLRRLAPDAKYLLRASNIISENKIGNVDENLNIRYT